MVNELPFESIKREIIIKKDSYGVIGNDPTERSTEETIDYGIVNVDKPRGPTSHQVSDYVKRILGLKKAGHSGTLDPNVTGVLPVALGRATRIVQTLLPAGKEYITLMHLHKDVDKKRIQQVMEEFIGKIRQTPPLKSAVKRVERTRQIYYIEIFEISERDVLFRVGCQAGTYIRKLCDDIGKRLKMGAHMQELRRTKAAGFDETTSYSLQDLTDAHWYYKNEGNDKFLRKIIQPVENGVSHLPKIWALDNAIGSMLHGIDLKIPGVAKVNSGINKDNVVAVMSLKNELIAIGNAKLQTKEILKKEKGVAISIHKVFMKS
ncbi:MAG: RNA-guided pseudouridylation complex pseudouridine synthase subunit Cbf5 [Nanoarchaeota archaeon]